MNSYGECESCPENTYSYDKMGQCNSCPFGKTSLAGSKSVDDCQFNPGALSTSTATQECAANEYAKAYPMLTANLASDTSLAESVTSHTDWHHIKHLSADSVGWFPDTTHSENKFYTYTEQIFDEHGSFVRPFPANFHAKSAELLFTRSDGAGTVDRYIHTTKLQMDRILGYQLIECQPGQYLPSQADDKFLIFDFQLEFLRSDWTTYAHGHGITANFNSDNNAGVDNIWSSGDGFLSFPLLEGYDTLDVRYENNYGSGTIELSINGVVKETIGANTLSYYHNSEDYVVGHVFMIKEIGAQLKKDLRITLSRQFLNTELQLSSQCVDCPANTYKTSTSFDQKDCVPCPENSGSAPGAISTAGCISCLNPCAAGQYKPLDGSACTNCPAGKYSENSCGLGGEADCVSCPEGKYGPSEGASSADSCVECAAGKYQTRPAQTSQDACHDCPVNTYQPFAGSSQCIHCHYSDITSDALSVDGGYLRHGGVVAYTTWGATGADAATYCKAGFYCTSNADCNWEDTCLNRGLLSLPGGSGHWPVCSNNVCSRYIYAQRLDMYWNYRISCGAPPCPDGTHSPTGYDQSPLSGLDCQSCNSPAGYACMDRSLNQTGILCPLGFYCTGGSATGIACPGIWTTAAKGATSIQECTMHTCERGYYPTSYAADAECSVISLVEHEHEGRFETDADGIPAIATQENSGSSDLFYGFGLHGDFGSSTPVLISKNSFTEAQDYAVYGEQNDRTVFNFSYYQDYDSFTSYLHSIGGTHTFNSYNFGGLYHHPGTGSLNFDLPHIPGTLIVNYGNPHNGGTARIYIDNTHIPSGDAAAGVRKTYSQQINGGENLKLDEASGVLSSHLEVIIIHNAIVYDFSPYNDLASWKAYATSIGANADSFTNFDYDGLYIGSTNVGYFEMVLPQTPGTLSVNFACTCCGHVVLYIDNAEKERASCTSLDVNTDVVRILFTQKFTSGQTLKISEEDTSVLHSDLILTISTDSIDWVSKEVGKQYDVFVRFSSEQAALEATINSNVADNWSLFGSSIAENPFKLHSSAGYNEIFPDTHIDSLIQAGGKELLFVLQDEASGDILHWVIWRVEDIASRTSAWHTINTKSENFYWHGTENGAAISAFHVLVHASYGIAPVIATNGCKPASNSDWTRCALYMDDMSDAYSPYLQFQDQGNIHHVLVRDYDVCQACPANSFAPAGSTSLAACTCESDSYLDLHGSTKTCKQCPQFSAPITGAVSDHGCRCDAGYQDLRKTSDDVLIPMGTNLARACGDNFDEPCATDARAMYSGHSHQSLVDGRDDTNAISDHWSNRWFEIDLGREVYIEEILVVNRLDCCPERLTKSHLYVSDFKARDTMSTIDKVEEMQAVSTHIHSFDRSCDNRCMLSVRRRARYVFVMSLTGHNNYYISIGEIEVYGVGGNLGDRRLLSSESYSLCALTPVLPLGTNLARACGANADEACTAAMSHEYTSHYSASKLVDGDYSTIAHNSEASSQWMEVDLGRAVYVEEIFFVNRQSNTYASRILGAELYVSNVQASTSDSILTNGVLIHSFGDECLDRCTISAQRTIRYVQVHKTQSSGNYLNIAEIEVYGVGGKDGDVPTLAPVEYGSSPEQQCDTSLGRYAWKAEPGIAKFMPVEITEVIASRQWTIAWWGFAEKPSSADSMWFAYRTSEHQPFDDMYCVMYSYASGAPRFYIAIRNDVGGTNQNIILELNEGAVNWNVWHHYTITFQNDNSGLHLTAYVDGVLIQTVAHSSAFTHPWLITTPINHQIMLHDMAKGSVGWGYSDDIMYFSDFRIYNTILTSDELMHITEPCLECQPLFRYIHTTPDLPRGTNLARACGASFSDQCETAVSSTLGGYVKDKINNGITQTTDGADFYHSSGSNSWIRLDLGRQVYVSEIWIKNRSGNNDVTKRINGAEVWISHEGQNSPQTTYANIRSNPNHKRAWLPAGSSSDPCYYDCTLTIDTVTRFIYVTRSGSTHLHFSELEVYGVGGKPKLGTNLARACGANADEACVATAKDVYHSDNGVSEINDGSLEQ